MRYPLLDRLGRAWSLIARDVGAAAEPPRPTHTFGRATPTLRWVNGDKIRDLYVDGMDLDAFCAVTGLELDCTTTPSCFPSVLAGCCARTGMPPCRRRTR